MKKVIASIFIPNAAWQLTSQAIFDTVISDYLGIASILLREPRWEFLSHQSTEQ